MAPDRSNRPYQLLLAQASRGNKRDMDIKVATRDVSVLVTAIMVQSLN